MLLEYKFSSMYFESLFNAINCIQNLNFSPWDVEIPNVSESIITRKKQYVDLDSLTFGAN